MLRKSWLQTANAPDCPFPLNNLPYGVFSTSHCAPHCGVAIGDQIFDCTSAEAEGLLVVAKGPYFERASWNCLMAAGADIWAELRTALTRLLEDGAQAQQDVERYLVAQDQAIMHLPFTVAEYTDFYAGRHHATNVGTMFRGAEMPYRPTGCISRLAIMAEPHL